MATIINGESQVFDGVKYTAIDGDAELKVEGDVVTGITSGKVTAEIDGAETTPTITVDGTKPFDFTAKAKDGGLNFTEDQFSLWYVSGKATYTAENVFSPAGELVVKFTNELTAVLFDTVTFKIPEGGLNVPFDESGNLEIALPGELVATVSGGTASGSVSLNGTVTYNAANKQITLAQGASIASTDLKIYNDANALDFELTAAEDSTFAIDSSKIIPYLIIKDGASFNIAGETFGIEGKLTITGGDVSSSLLSLILGNDNELSFTEGATLTVEIEGIAPVSITAPQAASITTSLEGNSININATDDNGISIAIGNLSAFSLNLKGTLKLDTANSAITIVKDTVVEVPLQNDAKISITANDDATIALTADENGNITFTPQAGDGTLQVAATDSNGEEILNAEVEVVSGSFTVNNKTGHIAIADGTEYKITVGEHIFTTSVKGGDAGLTISVNESGEFTFTPDASDGILTLEVQGPDDADFGTVDIEVVSGSFTLDKDNNLVVAKDTEMKLSFSEDYSVSFKATDDAGGKLSLVDGGVSYTPNEDEGKLELTVTNGETTRTTSLEVTGTVNYTLGGLIQLTEGTVVKNEFEDGEVLSITAKKDVDGIIYFMPDGGLSIASDDEDLALGINFPNNTAVNFDSIKGAILYKGGVVTLEDGTEMTEVLGTPPGGDSEDAPPEIEMVSIVKTEGGSSTIDFSVPKKITFTPGEGATLYTPHDFVIYKGSLTTSHADDSEGTNGVLSVGTVATKNSPADEAFTLEKAGTYTLNGNEIKTYEDGVEVTLIGRDSVVFDLGAAVEISGHEFVGGEGTQIKISNANEDISVLVSKAGTTEFDGKTFELTEDLDKAAEISLTDDGFEVKNAVDEKNIDAVRSVENVKISGTEDYTVKVGKYGTEEIGNVASGTDIQSNFTLYDEENKEWLSEGGDFAVVTAEAGKFTFGTNAYEITGDDSVKLTVDFDKDGQGVVEAVSDLNGVFEGKVSNEFAVNDVEFTVSGMTDDFGFFVDDKKIYVGGIEEGGTVDFESEDVTVMFEGSEVTVNDVTYSIEGDSDIVMISSGNKITSLDKDARLTVSEPGTYTVNGTSLDVKDGDIILGVSATEARIYKPIGPDSTTGDILNDLEISEDNVEYVTEDSDEETSLAKADEKAVVVEKDVESDKKITLGDKGNVAIVEETSAEVAIVGGKGKDTLVSKGNDVSFDMSKGGQNKIMATAGTVSLKGYDTDTKAGIKLTEGQADEGIKFDSGRVVLGQDINKSPEVIIGSESANFANIYTPNDEEKRVGFATEGNKVVDASSSKKGMLLIGGGEIDGMSLAEEIEDSTLRGGSGNDTILGGKGSYIDPGAGKNVVEMSEDGGSTINISSGRTSLENFNFVTDDGTADTIQTGSQAIDDIKVSDGDVVIKAGNGRVQINDAEGKTIAFKNNYTGNPAINLTAAEDELKVEDNGLYWATGKNAKVEISADYKPEYGVNIDLTNSNFTDRDALSFYGDIKEVDASALEDAATITGNDKANVITASAGGATMTGGAGNDTFVGGAGDDKFVVGEGKNSISGFDEGDTLNTESAAIKSIGVEGDAITMQTENGSVKVDGAKGTAIKFENQYTNEAIDLTVDETDLELEDNGLYWATGKNATAKLSNEYSGNSVINLADANFNNGGMSFYGDIKELDASAYDGNLALYGNTGNNVITAGGGNSTLWGGDGGNDTLIGGEGDDTFIFGKSNGNDVIEGATADDLVILSGVTLADLTGTDKALFSGNNDVKFTLQDGSSLTVKDAQNSGVAVDINGTKYKVNSDSGEWEYV